MNTQLNNLVRTSREADLRRAASCARIARPFRRQPGSPKA